MQREGRIEEPRGEEGQIGLAMLKRLVVGRVAGGQGEGGVKDGREEHVEASRGQHGWEEVDGSHVEKGQVEQDLDLLSDPCGKVLEEGEGGKILLRQRGSGGGFHLGGGSGEATLEEGEEVPLCPVVRGGGGQVPREGGQEILLKIYKVSGMEGTRGRLGKVVCFRRIHLVHLGSDKEGRNGQELETLFGEPPGAEGEVAIAVIYRCLESATMD